MALSVVSGSRPSELQSRVKAQLNASHQPIGSPVVSGNISAVVRLSQMVGPAATGITDYQVVSADTMEDLAAALNTALGVANTSTFGDILVLGDTSAYRKFVQVVVTKTP